MNQELMDLVMSYFVKKNIRDEDQLKELMYLCGTIEEELSYVNDPFVNVRRIKRRHYASE